MAVILSVGDIFGALPAAGGAPARARRQQQALVRIIGRVHPGRRVETFPLAEVDAVLAAKYLEACSPRTRYLLRAAAALFSRRRMRTYARRLGQLPDLAGFRRVALPPRQRKYLLPPSESELARAHQAVATMPPRIRPAAALALYAGLRRSDLMQTRRSRRNGEVLVLGGVRRIELPGWVAALLPPGQRLLAGNRAQRNATCTAAMQWLRKHLLPGHPRPLLELRRYYAWYIAAKVPPVVAMARLGCRSLATIQPFLQAQLSPDILAEWERRA